MSRFNIATAPTKTTNLAGGQAYAETKEIALLSILLTSFGDDKFYEKSGDLFERLKHLVSVNDAKFVAKAAIYARTKFGMRSITHVAAAFLAKHISGQEWGKNFYDKIVYRPDDMAEIISFYYSQGNTKLAKAIANGFALAIGRFDGYSLAKYRGEGKAWKLVDIVNMVRPKPSEKNAEILKSLVSGALISTDENETWETALTKAGQEGKTEEEKATLKKAAWVRLISEGKLKYFAALRNIRNVIEQAPEALDGLLSIITDEKQIKKSLVLPFRFITAFEEVSKLTDGKIVRKALQALNQAVDISISNVPVFDGETLVVLDVSGSMQGRPAQIGSLFAAVIAKSNNADFMVFSDRAAYRNVNISDSTITIANSIRFASGGTNFHSIFETANKKYDRIILLSDMQGWMGGNAPTQTFNHYKTKHGANPFIYSFDLNGYGTLQFPEQNIFAIAGFSEKILDVMRYMETDKKALINEVEKIEL